MNEGETVPDVNRFDATPANSSSNTGLSEPDTSQTLRLPVQLKHYDMTGNKYLHVFNHFKYENNDIYGPNAEKLTRHGTHADVKSLGDTFKALGFKITVHHDLPHQAILKEMSKVITMDHSATSCVAVAIMTHGQNGGIILAADRPYYLREVTDMMENCHPSLIGKPRLWFIQACRSGHLDNGRLGIPDDGQSNVQRSYEDTLVLYSSSPHYYSYRNGCGTWMMQSLCEVLNDHHLFFDMLQMLTLVNQAVACKSTKSGEKQMPEAKYNMTKVLKL